MDIYEQLRAMLPDSGQTLNSRTGMNWLRNRINDVHGDDRVTHKDLVKASEIILQPAARKFAGKMYMFRYLAEGRKTLPYYDKYPLIFIVEMYKDGFLGMNLHYLPPKLRIDLLVKLDRYRSNDKFDETTRLRINYELVRDSARLYSGLHILKRYKKNMIKSNIIQVLPDEWAMAALLPSSNFIGAGKTTVWNDTRRKLN